MITKDIITLLEDNKLLKAKEMTEFILSSKAEDAINSLYRESALDLFEKKAPVTKPQVVASTEIPTPRITAAYKRLLKMELATQIDAPADMPQKGVYLKIAAKGKAYRKAYNLLFA